MSLLHGALAAQGVLYVVTGVWPLLHMASFEAVTGPKTDDWLVHTVGLLLAVIGGVILAAVARRAVNGVLAALAVGAALSLAAVEGLYVAAGTIAPIYLLDAALETGLAALVALGWLRRRPAARGPGARD